MKKITFLLLFLTSLLSFSQVSIGGGDDGDGFNTPPIAPYYGYSYSQSIYLASEIGVGGDITSVEYALNPGTDFSSADSSVDVWIGHTTKTAFDSTSDWVDVSTLSQVLITGTVTVTGDVLTVTFSAPFTYNGTDNIVVAIDANEDGYGASSDYVLSTDGPTSNLTLDQRSDIDNSDPASPALGTLKQNRGNITFNGITQSCPAPKAITLDALTDTTANISWTAGGSETAWDYVFQPLDTGEPTGSGTATTNPLSLSGLSLAPSTGYEIYLRANCGGDYSSWVQFAFLTSANCVSNTDAFIHDFQAVILGSVLDASCWSLSNGGDTNTWSLVEDTTGNIFWNLLYGSIAHDDYLYSPTISVVDGVIDGFNFKGWNPNTTWPEVIDVLVVDAADNSVLGTLATDLNLPEPDATTGEYTVFTYDLSEYEGQDVKIAFHSTTTDQNAARIDDFTIDAFATLGTETNTLEGFMLYPNPVNDRLHLNALDTINDISIYNLLGQEVMNSRPEVSNTEVDMSNLPTGMYVVKVKVGEQLGTYRIVKE
jgi:hypothetical protein